MMFFTKKMHHRPLEPYKNDSNHPIGLKIWQFTQMEQGSVKGFHPDTGPKITGFNSSTFSIERLFME